MKKHFLVIPAIAITLGLTACSTNNQSEEGRKDTKEVSATEQKDIKRPLVQFFMNLSKAINEKDRPLNAYELSDQPTPEMKTEAATSASKVAEQIKQIKIPMELNGQKEQLKAALKDITNSYVMKAEELQKDAPSFEQANAVFTKGEDELGVVYVANKLFKPSLNKEVNS